MRVLSGQFKGRNLSAGSDLSIRPITNRLKETIFSILHDYVIDKKILDLFCGSGSLGIEALSRGARHVTFVDKEESSISVLQNNIKDLKIHTEIVKIVKSDTLDYLEKCNCKYQLIFSDPPFKYGSLRQMVDLIFSKNCLDLNGILILHHETSNPIHTNDRSFALLKQKKVGRSLLSFIIKEDNNV